MKRIILVCCIVALTSGTTLVKASHKHKNLIRQQRHLRRTIQQQQQKGEDKFGPYEVVDVWTDGLNDNIMLPHDLPCCNDNSSSTSSTSSSSDHSIATNAAVDNNLSSASTPQTTVGLGTTTSLLAERFEADPRQEPTTIEGPQANVVV